MKNEKKQTGRVNYFVVLAGGYLIYLAYGLFRGTISGESDIPVIGVVAGVVFAAVGALLLYREWKAYKYGKEHIDDPESWSEDPEVLEEAASEALDESEERTGEAGESAESEEET